MKNLVVFLLGLCLLACTEISYKEPQPKGIDALSQIPKELHGRYIMNNDTVDIIGEGFKMKEKGKDEFLLLSDTIVLKEYKGNYFVSYRDDDLWLLRIMKVNKNGDITLLAMDNVPEEKKPGVDSLSVDSLSMRVSNERGRIGDDSERKKFLKKLSRQTPVIERDGNYIIDPSPEKLNKLIKKGFFKELKEGTLKKLP